MDLRTRYFLIWSISALACASVGIWTGLYLQSLLIAVLVGPVVWFILKAVDRFGSAASGVFTGKGGGGQAGYSQQIAMAQRGDWEAAAQNLLALGEDGEAGALHALIALAAKSHGRAPWVVKGAQALLRRKDLSTDSREHFTRLVAEFSQSD